jgi:hypothetical protein
LQEIRELRHEAQQCRGVVDALRRELRRSREEVTERANAMATLQKATEFHSQELAAAKFQQKLSPTQQQPDETLVLELQRCQEELHQRMTLASTYKGERYHHHNAWDNWQPEEVSNDTQIPGDAESA